MRAVRLVGLVIITIVVQVAMFPHLRLLGVVPDLGLLVAVAVAYRHGAEIGALTGFFAGLGFDLFLATPLGMSALAYALAAYFVGVLQAGMLRSPAWIPPFLGLVAGAGGGFTFGALGVLAGVEALRTWEAVTTLLLAAVYDALLAPFVFWLVRRTISRELEAASGWMG